MNFPFAFWNSGVVGLLTHTSAASAAGGGTFSTSSIDTRGSTLIVIAIAYLATATPTFSDSAGNTWTALTSTTATGQQKSFFYYCAGGTTSSTHTFTSTGASQFGVMSVACFSGVGASPYQSQENGNFTTTAAIVTSGAITPTKDASLVLGLLGVNTTATVTPNSSMVFVDSASPSPGTSYGMVLYYRIMSPAAIINITWTWSGNQAAVARIASFK